MWFNKSKIILHYALNRLNPLSRNCKQYNIQLSNLIYTFTFTIKRKRYCRIGIFERIYLLIVWKKSENCLLDTPNVITAWSFDWKLHWSIRILLLSFEWFALLNLLIATVVSKFGKSLDLDTFKKFLFLWTKQKNQSHSIWKSN